VRTAGRWVLWSHVAGVLPDYRRRKLGAGIKWAQRTWALDNGYDQIRWTFDPMQAGNANFNLRVLGAVTSKISQNMYGIYDDALNPGLPTDRFEAVWSLDDPRVTTRADGHLPDVLPLPSLALLAYENGSLVRQPLGKSPSAARVEIPVAFSALGREDAALARDWQTNLREVLTGAFAEGLSVVDFIRNDGRCWYVLGRI
nr:GNAT family N-acetyltransferase [Anaerolineae bacterium]